MQRVQELNSKLLEKIKYDTDAYSGQEEENKNIRDRVAGLTSQNKALQSENAR